MSEQRFEYRIQKLLEKKGYLVINCARSKPFDLVAIKNNQAFLIELKAKKGRYPRKQQDMQMNLSVKVHTDFYLMTQSKIRGKILIAHFDAEEGRLVTRINNFMYEFLEIMSKEN